MAANDATDWDASVAEPRAQALHRRNRYLLQDLEDLKGAIGRLPVPLGLLAVLTGARRREPIAKRF